MSERVAVIGAREHPDLEILPHSGDGRPVTGHRLDVQRVEQVAVGREWRDALLFRNTLIAIHCTRAVVFPDGSKGGCWDAAREAVRFRRPVEVRWVGGHVEEYLGGHARRRKGATKRLPGV